MKKIITSFILLLTVFGGAFAQDTWQRINHSFFGDYNNSPRDMAVYNDSLYILLGSGSAFGNDQSPRIIKSANSQSGDANWIEVTPALSYSVGTDKSYQAITVTDNAPNYVYLATIENITTYTPSPGQGGPVVYRSSDGQSWTAISYIGLGQNADGAYDMIEFKDYLYISTSFYNSFTFSYVVRTAFDNTDPNNWTNVHNSSNSGVFTEFVEFKDTLYAISDNAKLFRTGDGVTWTQVGATSGFGNANNEAFTAIGVHNDSLFVGTRNYTDGPQLWKSATGTDNFTQVSASGFVANTLATNNAVEITDINSFQGNLLVSIEGNVNGSGVIVRSSDGINFITSTIGFSGNVSDMRKAITTEFNGYVHHLATSIDNNGEGDGDYISLQKVNLTPCSGIPSSGTIVASDLSVCTAGGITTLTVDGAMSPGIEFGWQQSTDAGATWTDITAGIGFDSVTYVSGTIVNPIDFRAKVTCTNSGSFTYTAPVHIQTSLLECYCESYAENEADSKIDSVAFNTISNGTENSGCVAYSDFSTIKTTVNPDSSYVFYLKPGTCSGDYDRYAKAFVDYNIDGDFDDAGEEIAVFGPIPATSLTSVFTYTVTIPSTTTIGETKMRVVLQETTAPGDIMPCGTYYYGETEDYNIYVAPPLNLVSVGSGMYCEGSSFVASYTSGTFFSGNTFHVEISDNTGSFQFPLIVGFNTTTTSGTVNVSLPATMLPGSYFARVTSNNPPSIGSSMPFTILAPPNISGTVTSGGSPATAGYAKLYNFNPLFRMQLEDSVGIDASGNYTFLSVPLGEYLIQAKPAVANNPGAYYGDTLLWENATTTVLQCAVNPMPYNINTNPLPALTGQATISGGVYRGINFGSGKTNLQGDPIPGVDVSLEQNPGGIIISTTVTSTSTVQTVRGTYLFSNVPTGVFDVMVDLPGIGMSSIHRATITGAQDTTHLDYYVDSNAVYIVPSTVSIQEKLDVMSSTKVYPNPAADYIYIDLANTNEQNKDVSIRILDVLGREIYTETTTSKKVRVSTSVVNEQGVYIVEVKQGSITSLHKIIVNK